MCECEALAGALRRDQRFGMILAPAALHAAAERLIGLFEIVRALADGLAKLGGANHIAAAHDHGGNICYCE